MVIEQINKLIKELNKNYNGLIEIDGNSISIRVYDQGAKLSLSTPVYQGQNYIPRSVRACLRGTSPIPQGELKTFLTVEEQHYQIDLNYQGQIELSNQLMLTNLLEEFSWQATEWRLYLDENDRNDLVHVRVK